MVWDGPQVLSYDHVLFSTASAVPSAAVALCGRPLLYVMQCYPHDDILWDPSLWVPSPRPSDTISWYLESLLMLCAHS